MLDRVGVRVVPHARRWNDCLAFVFVRGPLCVVSVGPAFVESTSERVSGLAPLSLLNEKSLQLLPGRRILRFAGPLYQGYSEREDFTPVPSASVRILRSEQGDVVQQLATAPESERPESTLTPAWREVLQRFARASEPTEWEHSGIDRADSALFGNFLGDELVAVAHYGMLAADAASIGVLTHPAYRNCGYGKAVVSAAMADAFSHGHVVLYQTLEANRASVSLAEALGCQDYARTFDVHLVEDAA